MFLLYEINIYLCMCTYEYIRKNIYKYIVILECVMFLMLCNVLLQSCLCYTSKRIRSLSLWNKYAVTWVLLVRL